MVCVVGAVEELICQADGIRGSECGFPVRIYKQEGTGRFVLRGVNEGGFACVDIDLLDIVNWLGRLTEGRIDAASVARALSVGEHTL